jgi:hypothetical protein
MKLRNIGTSRVVAAAIGIAFTTSPRAVIAQSGPVSLTSPAETPGQFSYGFADPEAPSDGQWVAIDFHRDPHCTELLGFNLLMFVDVPNALACALTVDVKEWWSAEDLAVTAPWQNPPWSPDFRTPSQARWLGRGAVPVYFVTLLEYVDAIGDGVLTVAELESLPSLLIGRATMYQYVQLNSGRTNSHPTMRDGHSQTVAHGLLADGRSFQLHRNTHGPEVTSLKIEFK